MTERTHTDTVKGTEADSWERLLLNELDSCPPHQFQGVMLALLAAADMHDISVTDFGDDMLEVRCAQMKGLFPANFLVLCLRNRPEMKRESFSELLEGADVIPGEQLHGLFVTTAAIDRELASSVAKETGGMVEVLGGARLCEALQENGLDGLISGTAEDIEIDPGQDIEVTDNEPARITARKARKAFPDNGLQAGNLFEDLP